MSRGKSERESGCHTKFSTLTGTAGNKAAMLGADS